MLEQRLGFPALACPFCVGSAMVGFSSVGGMSYLLGTGLLGVCSTLQQNLVAVRAVCNGSVLQ